MSNLRATCGPDDGFVWPGLVYAVAKVSYVLTICPYFDNLEFDIYGAGGLQCHCITSVTIVVTIRTLSVYQFKLHIVC